MSAPQAQRAIAPGDLVGLIEDGRPLLGVVCGVRGSRVDLRVGYEGKALQRPLRQLDLLAALPADSPIPERIAQTPWLLSADAVLAALPPQRELAAAWLLLQEDA
ncbi:MAG TPA: ribonuclease II, partial [Cyanobium sp.]|nr:ribonuclease II [Cyanobium sp.]